MTSPALMPRYRVPETLIWHLKHPGRVIAWSGDNITLRVNNSEKVINTLSQPHILDLIRRIA